MSIRVKNIEKGIVDQLDEGKRGEKPFSP